MLLPQPEDHTLQGRNAFGGPAVEGTFTWLEVLSVSQGDGPTKPFSGRHHEALDFLQMMVLLKFHLFQEVFIINN
jgi:hypothetical protein